jgi:hypothetical protein
MGIGFRFVMDEYFNKSLCQKSRCHISDGLLLHPPSPSPSLVLQMKWQMTKISSLIVQPLPA